MSLKKKLVATIGMFCLTCALLLVGVWAISSTSVEIGGTISFNATNIFATITGDIQGAKAGTTNPEELKYTLTTKPTDDQLATWKKNISFKDSGETVTYTITITNDSENRNLMVSVIDNSVVGPKITQDITLTVNGQPASYVSGQEYKVEPQNTAVVVATFVVDPDISGAGTYGFDVNLRDELAPHEHNYDGEVYYIIEDGKAYSVQDCACDEAGNKTEIVDAVVVTNNEEDANYYQTVLDGDIDGKTIVFAPGEYNDEILIRPSATTVSSIYNSYVREINENNALLNIKVPGSQIELEDFLAADDLTSTVATYKNMVYERSINNVTLLGAEGAVFNNQLRLSEIEDPLGPNTVFDAVRGEYLPSGDDTRDYKYASIFKIDGLTISNMDFQGKKGTIRYQDLAIDSAGAGLGYIKNVTIENCTFINEEDTDNQPYGALRLFSASNNIENFVIKNNVVDGHYQGFLVQNAKNIRIEGNKISNTTHNALAVQSNNDDTYSSGEIVIVNNDISNVYNKTTSKYDRAIRMGIVKNATITISGNRFANAAEVKGEFKEILKATSLSNVSYSFTENIYDGAYVPSDVDSVAEDATAEWVVKLSV